MTDYTRLHTLVAKFRTGSPNIAASFDEVEKILKQHDVVLRPFANVVSFGAKGDGTTDDTAAAQNAINAAAVTGGTVVFPSGVYLVSGLTVHTQVALQGINGGSYLVVPKAPASVLKLKPGSVRPLVSPASQEANGVKINDLILDTNKIAVSAIDLPDQPSSVPRFWTIERCLIINSGYSATKQGYAVYVGNLNTGCVMRDCQILSNAAGVTTRGANGWNGIGWYGQDGLLDNTFIGCFAQSGLEVLGGSADITFVMRGGGSFWNTTGIVVAGTGAVIDGASIDHNYNDGAYVGYPAVLTNCVFHSNSLEATNTWSHIKISRAVPVTVAHCRQAPQSGDAGSNIAKYFLSAPVAANVAQLGNFQDPGATLGTAWTDHA